ncbi:MAG TPA: leucine-rich repeat domain-containing protein, partial [Kofleriaceae bacterium]
KLRRLKLSNNAFGDAGARMLVEARLPALESLELIECGVEPPMIATLNDTFGCRLVHTTPDDVVLDLVGSVLEFHRAGSNSWAIAIDGTLRPVRWQAVARDHRPDQRVTSPWQTAELAPLDALVTAIAVGSTRQLTESGCRIDLGSDTRYVYDAAVHTSETAEISYELRGSTVTVTLDTYTTFD